MQFAFDPIVQAGIKAGKYAQVFTDSGVPLSIARDPATGRFVANAIGTVATSGHPLCAVPQLVMGGVQIYQNHRGFQALQSSLSVLQSTTAFIG